jgi:phosphate/sulfate permease
MPDFYTIVVFLLFTLAIVDLVVGVSNDAVNFLNSSIGSRVATRRVIMIVASAGILLGSLFSNGMMDVARNGVFNPELFHFNQVMVIFIAVMITDIILLDVFNTFGLPTSTTVSIVFELLGAAVCVTLIHIISTEGSITSLPDYINTTKAAAIISGIFLSILIAFTIGSAVQYIARLIFSFNYLNKPVASIIWSALALSSLTYFLVFKGLKGASFMTTNAMSWLKANTVPLMATIILSYALISYVLLRLQVNVFRVIVLFGTFSLAMAFAGNDLVNFIGVPLAGLESFSNWSGSGNAAEMHSVAFLKQPVRANSMILMGAGVVMILTLWFSKKARSVTETEVNLGRQAEGHERFATNGLARWLVRNSVKASGTIGQLIPVNISRKIDQQFDQTKIVDTKASFDLVRASVNLTTASVLIAVATSLKLPLSTTYVSFMVAMGTSLADRSWGRDSAVYRISGVVNVVGGWFATAIIAFTISGIFALVIYFFRLSALALLVLLAGVLIYRTQRIHKAREKKAEKYDSEADTAGEQAQVDGVDVGIRIAHLAEETAGLVERAIQAMMKEEREVKSGCLARVERLKEQNELFNHQLLKHVRKSSEGGTVNHKHFLMMYEYEQDIIQSLEFICVTCNTHTDNSHEVPVGELRSTLLEATTELKTYLLLIAQRFDGQHLPDFSDVLKHKNTLIASLEDKLSALLVPSNGTHHNDRSTMLVVDLLLEYKALVAISTRFVKFFNKQIVTTEVLIESVTK